MGTVSLRVSGVHHGYDSHAASATVLDDVNLELRPGEIFALVGDSGSGKSTLLRIMAGLEAPRAGVVEPPPTAGRIRLVFQEPTLLPWLTVGENVGLGLRYAANVECRDDSNVRRCLDTFGIGQLTHAYPEELSGGQAQRVALARALVTKPRVLLLDEPFAALDPPLRASLQDWLIAFCAQSGITAVLVTHDVPEAVLVADRVGVLSDGSITSIWKVGEVGRGHATTHALVAEITGRYSTAQSVAARAGVGGAG